MAKAKTPPSRNGFSQAKEAMESILFALILAFVFRGFVGQAFVIPTGSMAPTLLGAHIDHVCSNCGYGFAVSLDYFSSTGRLADWPSRVKCPNCDWEEAPGDAPAGAGDGIFTVSWPFAIGSNVLDPKRWDVIVFKAPFNMQTDARGMPLEADGQTNYIKRLIGLPGDVIEIIDGDIYTTQAAGVPEPIRQKLAANPPQKLEPGEKDDLNKLLQITRKPAKAQDSLWQVVFDADYQPIHKKTPFWKDLQAASGWKKAKTTDRAFQFAGTDAQPQFLQLEGKDFKDNCRYNYDRSDDPRFPGRGSGKSIVSDLQLRCAATWKDGKGPILLRLSKRDRMYTFEVFAAEGTGQVLQSALDGSQVKVLGTFEFPRWKRNWPVQLAFQYVDHQLTASMADKILWQSPADAYTAAEALSQPQETQPPLVQVGAADLQVELRHLAVMRDVYYLDDVPVQVYRSPSQTLDKATAVRFADPFQGKPGWATRDNPMLFRKNEYFMLGDNSPASYDSREWGMQGAHLANRDYRFGTVPADQLVGRAFFVYWPSWYRLFGLRVIPNIGQMRWIQ